MPRPYGWTDKFLIDDLLRRVEQLERRLDERDEHRLTLKKNTGRTPAKPTARGTRVSGAKT